MPSHRIHLKGPWSYELLTTSDVPTDEVPVAGTVAMPCDWDAIFGEKAGNARFRRKFHRPTNLDSHERVMLVLTEVRGTGSVLLNDHDVGPIDGTGAAVEFDITSSMNSFNELVIELNFDPQANPSLVGGLYGPVALDIRSDQ